MSSSLSMPLQSGSTAVKKGLALNTTHQRYIVWINVIASAVLGYGLFVCAKFIPPPPPTLSSAEVAALYQTNTNMLRLGFLLVTLGAGPAVAFFAVISLHLHRIKDTPITWSYIQMACGSVGVMFGILPGMFWTAAAFRPDRAPDVTVALHDLGWLFFIMPVSLAIAQNLAIAFAIIGDRSERPVFPRWLAYLSIWVAVLFLPAGVVTFFKTGAFAWNGLLAFWIALVAAMVWLVAMIVLLLKAISEQEREALAA